MKTNGNDYSIELKKKGTDFQWAVVEEYTGLTIKFFVFEDDAEAYRDRLVFGGIGFLGFTPKYLVEELNRDY